MLRARFHANSPDYRAVKWPPPGPYWCTGSGGDEEDGTAYSTVVAYVENESQILEFWPEASHISIEGRAKITFTDRFPQPEWWPLK